MDSEYGQSQLQKPHQGIDSATAQGGEEKTKKSMLEKMKNRVKGPMKKMKHGIAKKSKNHGDKQADHNLASPDNVESPDPEEEVEYEDDDDNDEQVVDPEVHGGDGGLRDTIAGARDVNDGGVREQDETGKTGSRLGDYKGNIHEDPAPPDSVARIRDNQQGSFPPIAGGDGGRRDTIAGARDANDGGVREQDETGKAGSGLGDYKGNIHEDPAAPGSVAGTQNNQQGSFPPTAGEEVDANPSLAQSFQRMAVFDQPKNEKHTQQDASLPTSGDAAPTGSHDQFSPEPMQEDQQKSLDTDYPGNEARTQQDESLPTSQGAVPAGSHDQFSPEPMHEDQQKSESATRELPTQEHNPSESSPNEDSKNQSYATKISAAAAGLASTVYGTTANAGTGLKEKVSPSSQQQLSDESTTDQAQQQPGYTQKVYNAVQPAKDRAAGLASAAYNKAAGTGVAAKEKTAGATEATKEKAAEAQGRAGETAAGAKNTFSEKTKPGDEEKALSQVISDMISTRKDTTKEKASEAADIGSEKAAQAKEKAYEARDIGAEKTKEQTGVAKEKANELKEKTVEAKDVGTEKAKETATQAREGTDNNGSPMVEKIKGAVTSLFGTRASADTQAQAAAEQQSTQEAAEGKQIQEQSA